MVLNQLKLKISDGVQVTYDKLVPKGFKAYLKDSLSDDRKQMIRKYMGMGKKQERMRKVNHAKLRLKSLGFTESGYQEMEALHKQNKDALLSDLAGFELVLWHLDFQEADEAEIALSYLETLRTTGLSEQQLRARTLLKAEALMLIGEKQKAQGILDARLSTQIHPDLYLAYANTCEKNELKLHYINQALKTYSIAPVELKSEGETLYDRLTVSDALPTVVSEEKVSVIIPVYQAGEGLKTAIESMISQTWQNIELFIVDDCSPTDPYPIVEPYLKDPRIRFLRTKQNSGPYVARNLALTQATGDFVTINDADDWSHPEKIERQVKYLMKHKHVMGNTSEQARITDSLDFYRRGKPGLYIFSNMSSFMFRRKEVLDKLGSWDAVRFAADSEFIMRIKRTFGPKTVKECPLGPLSFQRQSETSLTGNSAFGFPGYFMGIRKEYRESQLDAHSKFPLFYPIEKAERPFYAPDPMLPDREVNKGESRRFDTILMGDFRKTNPDIDDLLEKIEHYKKKNNRVGLVQLYLYGLAPDEPVSSTVRDALHTQRLEMLVYGEKIHAEAVEVLTPDALVHKQRYLPELTSTQLYVRNLDQLDQETRAYLESIVTAEKVDVIND